MATNTSPKSGLVPATELAEKRKPLFPNESD